MVNPLIRFLRRTYVIFIVLIGAVIFFLGYNTYLVDRSLVNLRVSLDKLSSAKTIEDTRALSSLLDYPMLNEVASSESQMLALSKIELAKDIIDQPKSMDQLNDAKFALTEAIKEKEKSRNTVLKAIDKISNIFVPPIRSVSVAKSEEQISYLKNKISRLTDKNEVQEVYYELAAIFMKAEEFDKAKEAYANAAAAQPETKLAEKSRFNIAWIEKLQGNYDTAINSFEKLAEESGQKEISAYSNYQVADTLSKKGEYEKAAQAYERVSGSAEGGEKGLAELAQMRAGSVYLYDLKEYDKAKQAFDKLGKIAESSSVTNYVDKVAIPEVVKQYRRAGFILLIQGRKNGLADKYKEALKKFDQALGVDPNDGISYAGKALAYLWLDDPDRALGFARQAVKLLPKNEIASVNLGYIYIVLGITDEAIVEYKRFISEDPFTALGYYNLGYAYILKNRLDDAVGAFSTAVRINPNFALAYNNLGWCHWYMSRYSQATEAFEKAVKLNPNLVDALFNLGLIYRNLGRYKDAEKKFEDVLKIDPEYLDAKTYLEDTQRIIRNQ